MTDKENANSSTLSLVLLIPENEGIEKCNRHSFRIELLSEMQYLYFVSRFQLDRAYMWTLARALTPENKSNPKPRV